MKHLRLLAFLILALPLFGGEPRKYIVEYHAGAFAPQLAGDAPHLRVKREFARAFRGAAIELADGQSVEDIARLPYVAKVHADAEVIAYQSSPFSPPQRGEGGRRPDEGRGLAVRTAPHPALRATLSPRGGARGEAQGNGIVVAVLDTGIDRTHPALAGKVIGGWDFVNDDNDAMDDHRHGTHVAGIIAAESAQLTGVAPRVSLLAYKVLNREGRGVTSDVIAGIERALDPNGDGDISDRADVVNLSLGNRGYPDDPLARAVDNAVAQGLTVIVAAGNDGLFHAIGSPAGAANAITVGASYFDDDNLIAVADFSSRGPATRTGAIKPDLLAPGVRILSTVLNHGYGESSGTSMATPYVAGLAALLLEQHPNWTPARVKAALVTSAIPIASEEVMTQGAGVVNFDRAAATTLVATPTQFNFGLDGGSSATWTSTRRITLRNDSASARTYHATIAGTSDAIAVALTQNEVTLAPGESRDVDATLTIDHALLGEPATRSFAFSGLVTFASNAEQVRVPWAFVRAGRATFSFDGRRPEVVFSRAGQYTASVIPTGEFSIEALLEPGTYDFYVAGAKEGDVRLVVREQQLVEGDVTFAFTPADAPHAVRMNATDHRGLPFAESASTLRSNFVRVLLPLGNSLPLPPSGNVLYSSPFSERVALLVSQAFVDGTSIHVAQHAPVRALDADRTLTTRPGEYASQEVRLHFPSGVTQRAVTIMPREWPRNLIEFGAIPPVLQTTSNAPVWTATLWMTAEVHEHYSAGVQFSTTTERDQPHFAGMHTPVVRRGANGFFAARSWDVPPPLPLGVTAGEAMEFGAGAMVFAAPFYVSAQGVGGLPEVIGARGELRRASKVASTYRVIDMNGAEVANGRLEQSSFFVPLPGRGKYNAEVRAGDSVWSATFDTMIADADLPSFTSLAIVDGAGRQTTKLQRNGNGSLVFSSTGNQAAVFFRRRGLQTWVQLTPVETGAHETYGRIFRVDLADALRVGEGEVELAIEIRSEEGNTARWQLTPAFVSSSTQSDGKRRSVRK
jgi:subtilisin family serine protease